MWDLDIVKVENTGRGGSNAEFLLLLGDGEAGIRFVDDESRDTLVAF